MIDLDRHRAPSSPFTDARAPPLRLVAPCAGIAEPGETRYDAGPWQVQGISRATWYRRSRPIIPAEPITGEHRWYCVRTALGGERRASIDIGEAGFDVFAPTEWRPAECARRYTNGSVRPARPARVVSLFRRYIFVKFNRADPSWAGINKHEMPSVAYIVGATPEQPMPLPDHVLDVIRGAGWVNGCRYDDVDPSDLNAPAPIKPGTPVLIINGAFVDRQVICTWSNGKRVGFLMQMLGGETAFDVAQSSVEAV
jgi:transcription antitermination factor NusG